MISELMDKRDKIRKIIEKEDAGYRVGLIGDKIALIKKKGADDLDKKIMTKIKKAASGVEIQMVDEHSS